MYFILIVTLCLNTTYLLYCECCYCVFECIHVCSMAGHGWINL